MPDTDLSAPPISQPTVTFILFAYNQEDFVAEAAQSVLAQKYAPMEVIFSDDASTDSTFEILQEIARTYRGEHRIRTVRNPHNMGVAAHVLARCSEAGSDVIIVAGGDDISHPERTQEVVAAFGDTRTLACCSKIKLIDEFGRTIRDQGTRPQYLAEPEIFLRNIRSELRVIQGCSAAYRRCIFPVPLSGQDKSYPEDILLSFLIHCRGGNIARIDRALVSYRQHRASLSNRPLDALLSPQAVAHDLAQIPGHLALLTDLESLARQEGALEQLDQAALHAARQFAHEKLQWSGMSVLQRARSVGGSLRRRHKSELRWKLLRLWGRGTDYLNMRLARTVLGLLQRRNG